MNRRSLIAILFGLLVLAQPSAGQESANLRGDSAQTRKRLVEAEQKLLSGKHADAVDDLQRVLDEAGDDLISLDGKHYRAARWIAHGILARLPEVALKNYRDRIDDPARKLLDSAKRTNDIAPLWELLDRYFVSRPADEGLLLLGDLLFDRGEFRTAERTWQRLLPDGGADIIYPGSRQDPATVRARIVLAVIYQSDLDRAARELTAFRKRHPGASGPFAGRAGPVAGTLQALLDNRPALSSAANTGAEWPAFGGGVDRSGYIDARLSGEWPAQPTWQVKLESGVRHEEAPNGPPRRPPFSHPVVARGHVFVTDGSTVFGYHLLTGARIPPLELASAPKPPGGKLPPPDPCPTLSVDGDRLYVRVGPSVIKSVASKDEEETAIACVRIVPNGEGMCRLMELWRVKPPHRLDGSPATWEGAPLVLGRRMWAAFARFEGGRTVHAIACYDPNDGSLAPDRAVWTVDVCDGPTAGGGGRTRHELLTLAGRHVVFCSNTGAAIALDAATGRRAWGHRYSRLRPADATHSPHPTPAVCSGGRLFVSPADGDAVQALDPETGRLLWQSGTMTGARILGVGTGRVVVSVEGGVRGIRALSADTGKLQRPDGWIQHDASGLLGYGQGLVTNDIIVWPTRSGLLFLRSEDGIPIGDSRPSPLIDPHSNYFGNVVYADGVLVVVGPTSAWAYVSQARQFGPPIPLTHRDPARVEFERIIDQAERALARREFSVARQLLADASGGKLPAHYRAWILARLHLLAHPIAEQSGRDRDAKAPLAPELRDQWVFGPDGVPITLGGLLEHNLGRVTPHSSFPDPPIDCRRNRRDSPTLHPGSEIARTLRLPPGSAPLAVIPGSDARPSRLFAATASELLAVSLRGGELSRFQSSDEFTCAVELADGFVAVGPSAVAVYGVERMPIWVFRVPSTEVLPARPGNPFLFFGADAIAPELSSFYLQGWRLLARLGERHMIALDLQGRRVAWVLGADETSGFNRGAWPGSVSIGPFYGVTGRHLQLQLSDGRRWLVDAASGKITAQTEPGETGAKAWWRQRPVEVAANALAIPDGPGLARVIDFSDGLEKWKHKVDGEASLTGEPPQLAIWPDSLVMAVRRNHGVELDRLGLADGEPLWTGGPAFLDADRITLANADADSERIVLPVGDSLVAISLESGRTLWKAKLPVTYNGMGWRVRLGRDCLVAYPEAAVPHEAVADVLGRLRRSFENQPALWRLPLLAAGAYDAWVARSVPVVLLDPETGERLVRFDIPARGPAVTAHFERGLAVVATGDRVVWLR